MNTANAFAFLLLGVTLFLLPELWPQVFAPNGLTGDSTQALWLKCMGPVQVAVGLHALFLNEIRPLWQLAGAWQTVMEREPELDLVAVTS
ncbi:hypothetical protein [Lacunisphaera limnophila]|nr:hypothetical protein [Lacunisphaera limnophila]